MLSEARGRTVDRPWNAGRHAGQGGAVARGQDFEHRTHHAAGHARLVEPGNPFGGGALGESPADRIHDALAMRETPHVAAQRRIIREQVQTVE